MSTTTQHFGRQVIGPAKDPYMVRYILFRWGELPRLYLHKFLRSDDERAPHNHPWWFVSLVLRGHYLEYNDVPPNPSMRKRFSLAFRGLDVFHRVALPNGFRKDGSYGPLPCWTLVVTGPDVRGWGFRCREVILTKIVNNDRRHIGALHTETRDRLVPWREFDGCGE